jgi:putative tryptophan/tyrosine transport system substrate-binding protein
MYLGAALLALFLVIPSRAGEAQSAVNTARIGYLSPVSAEADIPRREAFRQGLRALGYIEGQNAVIQARYADGIFERLPELAAEIVRLRVDVIVAAPSSAVRAAQQATQTIPIVMAFSGDPVGERFVTGLARPGGNITGHSTAVAEIASKQVEFSRQLPPSCLTWRISSISRSQDERWRRPRRPAGPLRCRSRPCPRATLVK